MNNIKHITNMSFEIRGRPKRPKARYKAPGKYRSYVNKVKSGAPLVRGNGVFDAIVNTPEPPCTDPILGQCPFLARCTKTGEVCPAFTRYIHLQKYDASQRIPNRHYDSFAATQQNRAPKAGIDTAIGLGV